MKKSTLLFTLLLAFQALPAAAQTAPAAPQGALAFDPATLLAAQFDAARLRQAYAAAVHVSPLPGARPGPYSYDELSETTMSMAQGAAMKMEQKKTVVRDKQGRTRIDHTFLPMKLQRTIIVDPVAKAVYLVCPERQEVLRLAGAPLDTPADAAPIPQLPSAEQHATSTSLGEKEVGGVKAFGSRSEIVTPAGAQGNEKDVVSVTETWFSMELGIPVYMRTSSPLFGEHFTHVENVKFAEVPASSFALPAGYKVRDFAAAQQ